MIVTERLKLIPLEMRYSDELLKLWGDEEVVRYTNVSKMISIEEAKGRMKRILEEKMDWEYPNHFVIIYGEQVIGIIGFPIISYSGFRCGIYYQFRKEYWKMGFGTESVRGLLHYIHANYKEASIYASVVAENEGSKKILEYTGFTLQYIQMDEIYMDGRAFDVIHYEKHWSAD